MDVKLTHSLSLSRNFSSVLEQNPDGQNPDGKNSDGKKPDGQNPDKISVENFRIIHPELIFS